MPVHVQARKRETITVPSFVKTSINSHTNLRGVRLSIIYKPTNVISHYERNPKKNKWSLSLNQFMVAMLCFLAFGLTGCQDSDKKLLEKTVEGCQREMPDCGKP